MRFNRFDPEGIQALAPTLGKLVKLTDLALQGENLGPEEVQALAIALPKLMNLTRLFLMKNNFRSEDEQAIRKALQVGAHVLFNY